MPPAAPVPRPRPLLLLPMLDPLLLGPFCCCCNGQLYVPPLPTPLRPCAPSQCIFVQQCHKASGLRMQPLLPVWPLAVAGSSNSRRAPLPSLSRCLNSKGSAKRDAHRARRVPCASCALAPCNPTTTPYENDLVRHRQAVALVHSATPWPASSLGGNHTPPRLHTNPPPRLDSNLPQPYLARLPPTPPSTPPHPATPPHPLGLTLIVFTPTFCSSGKNTKICRQGVHGARPVAAAWCNNQQAQDATSPA